MNYEYLKIAFNLNNEEYEQLQKRATNGTPVDLIIKEIKESRNKVTEVKKTPYNPVLYKGASDPEKIYGFLCSTNEPHSSRSIGNEIGIPEEIVFKRMSELVKAGLVRGVGKDSYKNRRGDMTEITTYKAVSNEPWSEVKSKVEAIKNKKVKMSKIFKQAMELLARNICDRGIDHNERGQLVIELQEALFYFIERNGQVKDSSKRYKINSNSYQKLEELIKKLQKLEENL